MVKFVTEPSRWSASQTIRYIEIFGKEDDAEIFLKEVIIKENISHHYIDNTYYINHDHDYYYLKRKYRDWKIKQILD
jgi:hypothetical protein